MLRIFGSVHRADSYHTESVERIFSLYIMEWRAFYWSEAKSETSQVLCYAEVN